MLARNASTEGNELTLQPTRAEIEQETQTVEKDIADLQKERESRNAQQADDQRGINKQQKNVERYLAKRQVLLHRKDECNQKIRDLGVLPEEAFAATTATTEKVRRAAASLNSRVVLG